MEYINIRFSYNGNLGRLQQKTIDNKLFVDSLLRNEVITYEQYQDLMKQIHDYFVEEIQKVMENPFHYINTLGG